MSHHFEEVQVKKYQDYLLTVDPAQWQWFESKQCFEVGDAAARPRLYFDLQEQFVTYTLGVYLEVDGHIVNSQIITIGKEQPNDHDELLHHITDMDHPPLLLVLLARLLRNRHAMMTSARPANLRTHISNHLTVWKHKLIVDLPHNVQERLLMYKVERTAARVLPKSRRG